MTQLLKQNIAAHISLSTIEMEEFCNLFQHTTINKKALIINKVTASFCYLVNYNLN